MGLFAELKRRNVFRVTFAYVVIAWLVMQVGDTMAPALHLDEWVNSLLAFFLILGLPLAIFFAWVFEMTPEGIKLEKDVDRSASIAPQTGKKVDRLIIGVLVVAVRPVRIAGARFPRSAGRARAEPAGRADPYPADDRLRGLGRRGGVAPAVARGEPDIVLGRILQVLALGIGQGTGTPNRAADP